MYLLPFSLRSLLGAALGSACARGRLRPTVPSSAVVESRAVRILLIIAAVTVSQISQCTCLRYDHDVPVVIMVRVIPVLPFVGTPMISL